MSKPDTIEPTCRPFVESDREFVVSTWSSSFRTSYAAGVIPMDAWAGIMRPVLSGFLDRPDVRTIVSFERTSPDFLYGFATVDTTEQHDRDAKGRWVSWPAVVYYVFVKANFRRWGIARGLLKAAGVDVAGRFLFACKTSIGIDLAERKAPLAKWNPLVVRFPKPQDK